MTARASKETGWTELLCCRVKERCDGKDLKIAEQAAAIRSLEEDLARAEVFKQSLEDALEVEQNKAGSEIGKLLCV